MTNESTPPKGYLFENRECKDCKQFKPDTFSDKIGICPKKLMRVTSSLHVCYPISTESCFEEK